MNPFERKAKKNHNRLSSKTKIHIYLRREQAIPEKGGRSGKKSA